MCDASNSALGVVLGQRAGVGQPVHVIAYASRTMDPAQQNYTTIEKELLAILLHIKASTPWFVDICNYVATSQLPPEASRIYKEKLQSDVKYYIWDDPDLWRLCSGKVIRRCILDAEINSVLQFYHSAPGGGHSGSTQTARKVLDCGLYWPTNFRDVHHFVSTCERCQKAIMAMNRRHEMPQQPILFCEVFDV
ncbi:putative mitochondrial protein, partial [Mucuna pruriens]